MRLTITLIDESDGTVRTEMVGVGQASELRGSQAMDMAMKIFQKIRDFHPENVEEVRND